MKQRTVWIIGGAALAVVLAAGAVWLLVPRSGSAEEQALAYLQALENGDLAAVKASGIDVPAPTAAAFAAASGHISGVAVTLSEESASSATVHASYVLAGEQYDADIVMIDQSGRWVPDAETAFGTAQVNIPAEIGDAVLPTDAETALLPAEYEVIATPTTFLEGSTTIQVGFGSAHDATLEAMLSSDATALAQEQLDEYLAGCTQPAAEVAPSCGITLPWAADFSAVSGISYRIEQAPTLSLTPTSFQAGDGILVATVTGTGIDGASEKSLSYRTSNWALRGDVAFTADDIVLSVW